MAGCLSWELPCPVAEPPPLTWQVRNPGAEVLHGQHSPHTNPIQECLGEVRATEAPGMSHGFVHAGFIVPFSSEIAGFFQGSAGFY